MAKTVVVYHSGYGHTQRVAQFVAEGAGAQLIAIDAEGNLTDAQWAEVNAADAIIMGSPTYMGMVSWQFKKFADATSKRWFTSAWKDKVAGGFTISANPSGDKLSTIQYFITLAMQQGMIWVGQPIERRHHQPPRLQLWRDGAMRPDQTRQTKSRKTTWTPPKPTANASLKWQPSCAVEY